MKTGLKILDLYLFRNILTATLFVAVILALIMFLTQALKFLEDGELLNIFPEGTRSIDGETLGQALAGVGFIAYKTEAPVLPVFLSGTQHVLPRKAKMPKLAKITVSFGKPLDMEKYRNDKASRETYERIGEEIMDRIAELQREARGKKG